MLHHARRPLQIRGQLRRVFEWADEVCDDAAVGARGHIRGYAPAPSLFRVDSIPKARSSSGTGGWSLSTGLVESAITTKRSRGDRDKLLPGLRGSLALHEPPRRVDLVGSVDGHVEPIERKGSTAIPRFRAARARFAATWRRTAGQDAGRPRLAEDTQRSSRFRALPAFRLRPVAAAASAAKRFSVSTSGSALPVRMGQRKGLTQPQCPFESMSSAGIRLLLADVDGTLVTQDKVLTDRAIQAVRKLKAAEIDFAITSGRPPRGDVDAHRPSRSADTDRRIQWRGDRRPGDERVRAAAPPELRSSSRSPT